MRYSMCEGSSGLKMIFSHNLLNDLYYVVVSCQSTFFTVLPGYSLSFLKEADCFSNQ